MNRIEKTSCFSPSFTMEGHFRLKEFFPLSSQSVEEQSKHENLDTTDRI